MNSTTVRYAGGDSLLRLAFEHIPAIVWTTDRDLRVTLITGAGLEAAGARGETYLGRTLAEVWPGEDRTFPPIAAHLRALAGETAEYDHEFAGLAFAATVRPIREAGGAIVGCVAMATDITERKRTEERLRATASKLEAIFQAFPDLYFHLDAEGTYLDYHAGRVADLFAPPETFLGRTVRDIIPGPMGEQLQNAVNQAAYGGTLSTIDYDLPLPGGRQSFECRVSPMAGTQALAIVRNVTDRRSLEEQLREAQKMEAVGLLAGGAAHDFNNVLTAILGYCHMLIVPLGERDPQRKKLEQIRSAAERASALTGQLLAFSRRQVLQPRVVSLNVIVTELGPMLDRLIGEDVEIAMDLESRLGAARVDPGQVGQVVMNLVVNARDAMPGGGRILVSTANVDAADRPPHPAMDRGAYVLLQVADSGVGMDAETLARIYEPFFTTKEPGRGTGLGLSTVHGIVQQSGGTVVAESQPGRGTSFRVYFPRVTASAHEPAGAEESLVAPGRGETVLVAEDEPEVRALIAEILRVQGYTVLEATDGLDAMSVAARHGPVDLLVADVVMPRKGGRDLALALRRDQPGLKVLYLSGYAGAVELNRRTGYLQKPFLADELSRSVRALLVD